MMSAVNKTMIYDGDESNSEESWKGQFVVMKKRDILFLCQFFYPEYNSSARLPFETAKFFAQKGFLVDALCGYPKEYINKDRVPIIECVSGVNIHRIRYLQMDRRKKLGRLVNFFSFVIMMLSRLFLLRNYKMLIVYSNPPILPLVPVLANILWKTPFVFVAYDVYPEIAYASKTIKSKDAIDLVMKWLNKRIYGRASLIVAMTEEMRGYLLANRPELTPERVVTIENWACEEAEDIDLDTQNENPQAADDNAFIVSYMGNMGTCQDMDTLCGAIDKLTVDDGICFQFAGHGNKQYMLKQRYADSNIVKISGYLTGNEYEQAMVRSSCFVVSLDKDLKGLCAPSKYYSCLLAGRPIITITEEGSYLQRDVEQNKIGYSILLGDSDQLVKVLKHMRDTPELNGQMCQRAKMLYSERYAKCWALAKYEEVLVKLL